MSESITVAIIISLAPTITSIASLYLTLKSRQAIQEVHLSLNSRLDALLKSEKSVSKTEGKKEGLEEGRNEKKEDVIGTLV